MNYDLSQSTFRVLAWLAPILMENSYLLDDMDDFFGPADSPIDIRSRDPQPGKRSCPKDVRFEG